MDVIAEVSPGACGLTSRIKASSPDGMNVVLEIESACLRVQAYAPDPLRPKRHQGSLP